MDNRVFAVLMVVLLLFAGFFGVRKAGRKKPGTAPAKTRTLQKGKPGQAKVSRYGAPINANGAEAQEELSRGRWSNASATVPRSSQYEKAMDLMDSQNYEESANLLRELKSKYSEDTYDGMLLAYNEAESYFYGKSMNRARRAYQQFLEKYPDSPFTENVKAAIDFIDNIEKYKQSYVSPDQLGK